MSELNNFNEEERKKTDEELGIQRKDFIQMRLAELDEQDNNITARTDKDFLQRKTQIDAEFDTMKKRLDHFRQIQHQAVSRRTFGEFAWLQSSSENQISDDFYAHNKAMFPSNLDMYKDYEEAEKKFKYLEQEIKEKNLHESRNSLHGNLNINDNVLLKK